MNRGFYEEAASLSEKYFEFVALVAICEATGDKDRLEEYMERFKTNNFASFVFDWHVREGKQGKLLKELSSGRQDELSRFLQKGHSNLAWMHEVQMNQFGKATETLKELGLQEAQFAARKKVFCHIIIMVN